ncbi:glycoside hydrolase family 3 N-terminal domain-containing protein [Zoogloea sp.]|uniref:glycoside hydrolase family 3 N-terminal domain-containing protein n=1 Tax=Zoogloea sp. TaxID=49181 RepID=UPI001AD17F5F|nr:glycoside hydrolase family 3 N-terminal domain-containing protein [Zoogloea sp.]MBN8283724.1 hypothetical protein [Zoogloea sp.]
MLMGLSGATLTADEERLVRDLQPVGFLIDAVLGAGPREMRALTDSLRKLSGRQPVVAVGFEVARRLAAAGGGPVLPGAADLIGNSDLKTTATAGMLTGEMFGLLGINMCLGPVLDLGDPGGAAGAWSRDPQRVIDHAGQWNRWLRKRGAVCCAGRFPIGNAARSEDDADTLQRGPLLPYTALMPELDAIRMAAGEMAGIESGLPATMASGVVGKLLRDRLGFDHHAVVSADLAEVSAVSGIPPADCARKAVEAGCDLILLADGAAMGSAIAAGMAKLPIPVLGDAWQRVERLRDKLQWPRPWSEAKWAEWSAKACDLLPTFGWNRLQSP